MNVAPANLKGTSMGYAVLTYFDNVGNKDKNILIGQVRRLVDELGYWGIISKSGQSNCRVKKQGFLRVIFLTRELAKRYQDIVAEFWEGIVSTRRFKSED